MNPPRRPRLSRNAFKLLLFVFAGAIINVAVAWAVFPGQRWEAVEKQLNIDQSHLIELGLQTFESVESETLRCFGILDREYSIHPASNKYALSYARETFCGWPMLAFHGLRWGPIVYSTEKDRYVFTGEVIRKGVLPLYDGEGSLGEREYLPLQPLWPGFAINTIFYAAVLWVLFAVPGAVRRRVRIKRGQCAACGYSLRGGTGEKCPECGATVFMNSRTYGR